MVSKAIIVVPNDFQRGVQILTPIHFRRFSCCRRTDFVGTEKRQVCLPKEKAQPDAFGLSQACCDHQNHRGHSRSSSESSRSPPIAPHEAEKGRCAETLSIIAPR
jgi:hypothetical protein